MGPWPGPRDLSLTILLVAKALLVHVTHASSCGMMAASVAACVQGHGVLIPVHLSVCIHRADGFTSRSLDANPSMNSQAIMDKQSIFDGLFIRQDMGNGRYMIWVDCSNKEIVL